MDEKVIFVGKIVNEKIPKLLVASDIFVLPSLSEGFPVVLLEAMASGLPIITTRTRGLSEIIQENVNGFLVNPKNATEIADKIKYILTNDKLTKRISIKNKHESGRYDWAIIVKKLELLYKLI